MALEPATLVPLQLLKSNGTRCIMVNDPKQLPATVRSNTTSKFLYECSMFVRFQTAGHPVKLAIKISVVGRRMGFSSRIFSLRRNGTSGCIDSTIIEIIIFVIDSLRHYVLIL
ncbi:hypothetical protein Ddye_026989 [Dipteronia dyeriana]|uniref:DNA2/NAM7 helicase helicase domain-containing protein n=1 Tax=Dipteronia dyeriana TaxID=168575 RepID=A0AAD9WPS1_9ROSI|nr:hypothetical protein Ddye_026989 [Dipteronia dyeriana]